MSLYWYCMVIGHSDGPRSQVDLDGSTLPVIWDHQNVQYQYKYEDQEDSSYCSTVLLEVHMIL